MIRIHLLEPDYWRRRGLAAALAECGDMEVCDDEISADVVLIDFQALLMATLRDDDDLGRPQLDVLRLLHEGLTNKEIGNRLGLAEATVKARMNRLYKRFGVTRRLQLLATALRERILKE